MSGKAGELAKWTVQENAHGNPSLQLACWRPFPTAAVRPRTAKSSPSQVMRATRSQKQKFRAHRNSGHTMKPLTLEEPRPRCKTCRHPERAPTTKPWLATDL